MQFHSNLFIDTEVKAPYRGALDQLGRDQYARHPNTQLMLVSYAIDDGELRLWDRTHDNKMPGELAHNLLDPGVRLVAHEAGFDRVVIAHKLAGGDLTKLPPERWYCTAARARIHGLPAELGFLSDLFKLGAEGKQAERGAELIQLFCEQGADPKEHVVEWLEFCDYSIHDISAMRKLFKIMPEWCFTEHEQRIWALNERINDRGFKVDLGLANKMIAVSSEARTSLDAKVADLSDGTITKATQRERVLNFVNADPLASFQLDNMRAESLRKALRDEPLTDEQREMIELRLMTARSSVSKCKTALMQAGPDSRVRYAHTYAGGGRIGRFSHKGFQPGNMPRPSPAFKKPATIAAAIDAINCDMAFTIWGDEANSVCADNIRGLIEADIGKKLIQADYSNIEGRVLAWYADEEWKLQAYRDKDAGIGEDLYKIIFHRMTGIPFELIDDFLRQQGKGADLSMGYEGGVGAYMNIANSYQLDLRKLAREAPKTMRPEFMEQGEWEWEWAVRTMNTLELPKEIYVACSANKHAWRDAHPATVGLWRGLLDCAKTAVLNPGKLFQVAKGKVHMKCSTDGHWLAIQVPSGRKIMLAMPRMLPELKRNAKGEEYVTYKLTALKAPTWHRESVYGGLTANLITQGFSRDILANGMLEADADGFPIVLDIHDEIVAEVDEDDWRGHDRLIDSMLRWPRKHFPGLPLTAAGYTAKRYRKG